LRFYKGVGDRAENQKTPQMERTGELKNRPNRALIEIGVTKKKFRGSTH